MKLQIKISKKPVLYYKAYEYLEEKAKQVKEGTSPELIWILEHENVYTCGTSGKEEQLLEKNKIPIFMTNRGGKWTYHGDGQKIVYFVLDMNVRGKKIKQLVRNIEKWIIEILNEYKIEAFNDPNNVGIWIKKSNLDYKIAAIGIKVKKWVAYHGFALNLNVDKNFYDGIIPCGINDKGIINFSEIKKLPSEDDINEVIVNKFKKIFL